MTWKRMTNVSNKGQYHSISNEEQQKQILMLFELFRLNIIDRDELQEAIDRVSKNQYE